MVKVIIGSLVICHLLSPTDQQAQEGPGVTKILGEIIDITKGNRYIEKVDKKEALEVETDILIIKGKNKEGVFQVDARACMAVRKESEEERQERVSPRPKKTIVKEEELESENTLSQEQLEEVTKEALKEEVKEIKVQPKVPEVKAVEEQALPAVDVPVKEVAPEMKEEVKPEASEKKEETKKEDKVKEENKGLLDYLVN